MLWRVMPFKALRQSSGFCRLKPFIQTRRRMRVEIIRDQYDLFYVRIFIVR